MLTGIDGWRFEPMTYPRLADMSTHTPQAGYSGLSDVFVEAVSRLGDQVIVEAGSQYQKHPVYSSITEHASRYCALCCV